MLKKLLPDRRLATPFVNQTTVIHGGDYNPDQWLPTEPNVLEQDASALTATGINSSSVGIFAWTPLEPSENQFDFGWLDRVMDIQAGIGNRVILASPSGAMPAWLAEKYPDARRVDRKGLRSHYGDRHNHCWSSPNYHERVQIINTKLAERYKNHPALSMWHISNELSGECYCDLCRASWAKWLEEKYGTLKKMNDAHWAYFWSHHATEWRHVEPTDGILDSRVLDWRRFTNQQLINWYTFEAAVLRAITPAVPITTNFMTTSFGHDYQSISRVVDVVTDDQYPAYDPDQPGFATRAAYWSMKNDLYRCFKTDRTFMLMESCPGSPQWRAPQKQKRPNVHRLEMLQAIAHGADGTCYFQLRAGRGSIEKLHGAVIEHWGTEKHTQTRRYRELRELSDTYEKIKPVLGTTVRPEVAIIYDWESKWGQQASSGTGVRDPDWSIGEFGHYDNVAVEHYINFWKRGIPVNVISNDRDLTQYKLIVLPMHWIMTPEFAQKIKDYIAGGGTVVATWDTAMADQNNNMLLGGWPGQGLDKVFGLWIEEVDRLKTGIPRAIQGLPGSGAEVAVVAHLDGAKAIATFNEDYYAGKAAVTVNLYGKGRAFFIGTRLDSLALSSLYEQIISDNSLIRIFDSELPVDVTVQLRGTGEAAYLFILNFSTQKHSISIGDKKLRHLDNNQVFTGTLNLEPLAADVYLVM